MTAEIIRFPCAAHDIADMLTELAELARQGRVTGVMFAANMAGGGVATAYKGVDLSERAVMLTHMQFDLIDSYINVNYFE